MTVRIDRNYLKHRKFTYFELMAFATMSAANPGANPDNVLAEMLRLELVETSPDVNKQMAELILHTVSKYYGFTAAEILGTCRKNEFVRARQMVCYIGVKYMHQHSLANCTGINRNTVQHSKTKHAILMETERDLVRETNEIVDQIKILRAGVQFEFLRECSPTPETDLAIINQKQ